jgi:Protein of unknown function (DUF3800)
MDVEIYCDESGLEALTRKDAHKYIAIGALIMPAEYRTEYKQNIIKLKNKHHVHGEIKWGKVSPKFVDLYKDIIDYFFSTDCLRFRVIIIESSIVDNHTFNQKDAELGFYKFYYQLLHHRILDFNSYDIFLDHKINRDRKRLSTLRSALEAANFSSKIEHVQALPSEESVGIQLADVFTGLTAAKFNEHTTSHAKLDLIARVEGYLGKPLQPTTKGEMKFNVFKINLTGGW